MGRGGFGETGGAIGTHQGGPPVASFLPGAPVSLMETCQAARIRGIGRLVRIRLRARVGGTDVGIVAIGPGHGIGG